jgi:DNA-directed RNA polymerase specialized sigma subunit
MKKKVMTLKEVAQYLKLSESGIRKLVKEVITESGMEVMI